MATCIYKGTKKINTDIGDCELAYFECDESLVTHATNVITATGISTIEGCSASVGANNVAHTTGDFVISNAAGVVSATLYNNSTYRIYVNGTFIGGNWFTPSTTRFSILCLVKFTDTYCLGVLASVSYTHWDTTVVLPETGKFGYVIAAFDNPPTTVSISMQGTHLNDQLDITMRNIIKTAVESYVPPVVPDPYGPGGQSGPGGGDGSFDFTSTDIPIPPLPSIGAYNTGFISLYRPSESDLQALASYLWSGPFDPDNFKKIFANPMDCILGLHIIPTAGSHPVGSTSALMVGNISTGLTMQRLSEQYYELDCGIISIDPKWGAYLDYSPYSKLSLFLPYIGFVTISPDDCMNGTIRVVYHVDVLSGSCCAYVYCTSNQGADGHTLYTFTGGCACDCPVTEGQYTNGLFGSLQGGIGLAAGLLSASPAGIMGGIEEAANAALSMVKPDVGRSGSFGGSAGLMGIQYPYLVLTIPKMCTPGGQNIYRGYPSFVTEELGNISGYASIEITHMEGMSATDEEVSEIMGLLGEGVIF